jgi:hypothetical protein
VTHVLAIVFSKISWYSLFIHISSIPTGAQRQRMGQPSAVGAPAIVSPGRRTVVSTAGPSTPASPTTSTSNGQQRGVWSGDCTAPQERPLYRMYSIDEEVLEETSCASESGGSPQQAQQARPSSTAVPLAVFRRREKSDWKEPDEDEGQVSTVYHAVCHEC